MEENKGGQEIRWGCDVGDVAVGQGKQTRSIVAAPNGYLVSIA